jgi:hypothetical protein
MRSRQNNERSHATNVINVTSVTEYRHIINCKIFAAARQHDAEHTAPASASRRHEAVTNPAGPMFVSAPVGIA